MTVQLGYLHNPTLLSLAANVEGDRLVAAGAAAVFVDCDSRSAYRSLICRVASSQVGYHPVLAPVDVVWVVRLSDLGSTAAAICAQVEVWRQLGVRLGLAADSVANNQVSERPGCPDGWIEAIDRELQSRTIAVGHARSRLARRPPPGPPPRGYCRQADRLVLDADQSALVRLFFDRYLLYGSLRGAVRYVREQLGESISVATGRRWLLNPIYRGDLAFKDGTVLRDTHAALLSRDEAAQIDRWLSRNQSIPARSASAPRSLAGLVMCRTCQQRLRIVQAKRRQSDPADEPYRYLRCDRCRYSHRYGDILNQTIGLVCTRLPQAVRAFSSAPIQAISSKITSQIDANNTKIININQLQQLGEITPDFAGVRRNAIATENARLSSQLDRLPPENLADIAQAIGIETFWQDLSESERRAYFREFIRVLTVDTDGRIEIEFVFRS